MSTEIVQVTDYNERNLPLVLEQFKNSPNVIKLISIFNDQVEALEGAAFEVRDYFWIDTAEGTQLNTIGDILNTPRDGRNDTEYRLYLREVIALNFSGTPEDIINVLLTLFNFTSPVYLFRETTMATYLIYDYLGGGGIAHSALWPYSPAGVLGLFVDNIWHGDPEAEADGWLIDGEGNDICCAFQNFSFTAITGDEDELIYGDGDSIELITT